MMEKNKNCKKRFEQLKKGEGPINEGWREA